jgi:hypothetical protein
VVNLTCCHPESMQMQSLACLLCYSSSLVDIFLVLLVEHRRLHATRGDNSPVLPHGLCIRRRVKRERRQARIFLRRAGDAGITAAIDGEQEVISSAAFVPGPVASSRTKQASSIQSQAWPAAGGGPSRGQENGAANLNL